MRTLRAARYLVRRLPFLLLACKAAWALLAARGFDVSAYWFVSELQAHSLLFCAVLAFYAYIGRHCLYLWVCIFGLATLNVLNILYYFNILVESYLNAYTWAVFATCLTFALLHAVRKIPKTR